MKAKSGMKYAVVLAALIGAYYGGTYLYDRFVILPKRFPLLHPGRINLVGIKLDGEKIVVSNGIARLQQTSGPGFGGENPDEPSQENSEDSGDTSGTPIPLAGVIGALSGDPNAAGELVAAMASIDTATIPPKEIVWQAGDVRAALSGEPTLKNRLEEDICQKLDGGLLPSFRKSRIFSGIYIRLFVPVRVPSASGVKTLSAPLLVPFKTSLVERVSNNKLIKDKFSPTAATWRGVYEEAAQELGTGPGAAPRRQLEEAVAESRCSELGEPASNLISRVTLLATEKEMSSAGLEVRPKPNSSAETGVLRFEVTDESRMRLWQYTVRFRGCQLLFIYDGVGIAAPFAKGAMKYSTVTITNLTDVATAREAVEVIDSKR